MGIESVNCGSKYPGKLGCMYRSAPNTVRKSELGTPVYADMTSEFASAAVRAYAEKLFSMCRMWKRARYGLRGSDGFPRGFPDRPRLHNHWQSDWVVGNGRKRLELSPGT